MRGILLILSIRVRIFFFFAPARFILRYKGVMEINLFYFIIGVTLLFVRLV